MNDSLNQSDLFISCYDPVQSYSQSKIPQLSYSLKSTGVFTDTQRDHLEKYLEKESDDNFFGLPIYIKDIISEHRRLNSLYPWQEEFLTISRDIAPKNILYSLPTSGGKTLVAEIEMIKSLLLKRMSVIFILPFVSIVQEKFSSLTPLGLALDFFVEEYAGTKGRYPIPKAQFKPSLFVATIEKASIIINSLLEENRLFDISLVVVDEFHMIGEGRRGAILENTITKIKSKMKNTRIIAMSATLKNLDQLASFLDAHLYQNDFRPVNLNEYVKYEKDFYRVDRSILSKTDSNEIDYDVLLEKMFIHDRRLPAGIYNKQIEAKDPDHLVYMVSETLQFISENGKGGSCLIFCPTKQHCESTAKLLGELLNSDLTLSGSEDKENSMQLRKSLLDELKLDSQSGLICSVLQKTVIKGVAYHHSGLTGEERKVIEDGFRDGILRIICATSTLAAGVNLPARRVIIRKPMIGRQFISWSQYHQMIGRAGRAGYDTLGESIILLNTPEERKKYVEILFTNNSSSEQNMCKSALVEDEGRGLRSLILSTITLKLCNTFQEIFDLCSQTLYALQNKSELESKIKENLIALICDNLIGAEYIDDGTQLESPKDGIKNFEEIKFIALPSGRGVIKGGLDLDNFNSLLDDLRMASTHLVTTGVLHLLYLVCPMEAVENLKNYWNSIDWMQFYHRVNQMDKSQQKILEAVGFNEAYLLKKASNSVSQKNKRDETPLYRLYIALALNELWPGNDGNDEIKSFKKSIMEVSQRYQIPRGNLQSYITAATSTALGLSTAIASEFKTDEQLWAFGQLFPSFATKLAYCVKSELLPLVQIPGVKQSRARKLHDAGLTSVDDVAASDSRKIMSVLKPFITKSAAENMIQSARMILLERLNNFKVETENILNVLRKEVTVDDIEKDLFDEN